MVVLNKIYTRTGDDGTTALGDGARCPKFALRVEAYGTVDETNAAVGMARIHLAGTDATLDQRLMLIQNDLFDLGADLCVPDRGQTLAYEPLRITQGQVDRLETEIDDMNANLKPLRSFVLPGGTPAAAALHVARTVCRRAERLMVQLASVPEEPVGAAALKYINRLSDYLFVASRHCNAQGQGGKGQVGLGQVAQAQGDVLWIPGKSR